MGGSWDWPLTEAEEVELSLPESMEEASSEKAESVSRPLLWSEAPRSCFLNLMIESNWLTAESAVVASSVEAAAADDVVN